MWIFDRESLAFLAVNDAATRQYGYTREEFLRMSLRDLRPAEDIALVVAWLSRNEEPFQNAGVWRHRKKDGSMIDVEVFISTLEYDGRPARMAVLQGVTERKRMEASLVESEARLRTYLESASEGILVLDPGGRIEFVNAKTEEIFGYSRRELIGQYMETLLPDTRREPHLSHRRRFQENPRVRPMGIGLDLIGRRKDGSEFPVEVGLSSVPRQDGIVQIAYINDITVRKRAEEALKESEQRFRSLVESTTDWVWETDENAVYTYVSPQVRAILGYEPEEVLGRTPFDLMPLDEVRRVREVYDRVVAGGLPIAQYQNTAIHKDGHLVVLETSGAPFFDFEGRFRGYRGIDRDITERNRAAEDLRSSQASLARAQRIARLGNWEEDVATGELRWSEEVYRIFQVPPETVPTLELFFSRVHAEDRPAIQESVRLALSSGRPYSIDHRIVLPDGTERNVREHAEVQKDERGSNARLLGTVQDITEYKRLEEQLRQSQRMEAVGRLAGGVAHDFNNLLTIITGYAELLGAELGPDSPERRDLGEIKKAAERAGGLTRQLLAFSRRQILQLKVLNLNAVIADLDKMLRRLIGEDVALATRLHPEAGLTKADPTQIEQVIMNLAVNARDAMPNGGKLMIETAAVELDAEYAREHPEVQPGSYVMLAVSDTGTGMTSDIVSHIFEPFFTTKGKDKGTGLGLSTVYGIVRQSGGSIFVYSEPGKGSTFKIYLPRVEELSGAIRSRAELSPVERGSETILIVEDEEGVRTLIRTILQTQGYTVLEAQRGKDALHILENRKVPVELMITDVIMPEMSGRELYDCAAQSYPHMKVLFISGYTDEAIVQHGVLDPGVPFLQKPFTHDALTRKIRQLLGPSDAVTGRV